MNRISVLQEIINIKRAKTYLEIGIHEGKCFNQIRASKKFAVDPIIRIQKKKQKKRQIFEMTSDAFFNNIPKIIIKKGIDVVLIDGLHTYEQSLKDVLNTLNYLTNNGIIVIHDCNPPHEPAATPAFSIEEAEKESVSGWTGEWNGDVWKTIVQLRSNYDNLKIFVLDCDYGLGIIVKGKPESTLNYSTEEIKNLTYKDLEANRVKLLNLKNPEFFSDFIYSLKKNLPKL